MTSNSDNPVPENQLPSLYSNRAQPAPAAQRSEISQDLFELLSAYLDGEVSADEDQRINEWLSSDAEAQRLYQQQLTLRRGLQTLPTAKTAARKYANPPATVTLQQLDLRLSPVAIALLCAVSTVVIGILTSIVSPPLGLGDWLQLGAPSVNQETQSPDLE